MNRRGLYRVPAWWQWRTHSWFPGLQILFPLFLVSALSCAAQSAKPVITKVDPPNWFTQLPNSLLLVHGQHLENTTFALQNTAALRNTAAKITETTISANGHWAFLGLASGNAAPGTLEIVATNRFGSTSVPYTLSPLRPLTEQPRGFGPADVMYLIMPDRFADGDLTNDKLAGFRDPDDRHMAHAYHGGDLRGITDHLDYLQQLGVTAIWTTPLYDNSASQSGQTYHGYSATDMYAVDPHFGTIASYRALVTAAHARGMKVVLDTVPNHVGPDHPWANDPPTPDWFHGTVDSHINAQFDFSSIVNPDASAAKRTPVLNGWFADRLPDLNQDNPLVAIYLMQNAIWWIESANLDGLRIDTFAFVPRSFWHNYDALLHQLYPHLGEVGEIFNGDPRITSFFAGGRSNRGSDGAYDTELNTPFDYPMFFALRAALTHRKPMTAIEDVLQQDRLYPHPERLVTFIGNHDNRRFLDEPGASPAALHLAFGLLATLRGMPQLYYGDELDMTGGDDPANRKDFPGGFPGDQSSAFLPQTLDKTQGGMKQWVTTLMQLRLHSPTLQTGRQQTLLADRNTFAFVRAVNPTLPCAAEPVVDRYLVIVNNDSQALDVTIPEGSAALTGCLHFDSLLPTQATAQMVNGKLVAHLPGQEIGIFQARP